MHLVVDLRFYRPEPYGLAVHIRDLFQELLPKLEGQSRFDKITLIFDAAVSQEDFSQNLPWWDLLKKSTKFKIHQSNHRYYTLAEQTLFLQELYSLKADLVYFFTFNYPIFYNKPFVYQVLDLNILKTRTHLDIKVQAMLWCFKSGINHAKHILFLGRNTQTDAATFSGRNLLDKNQANYKPNTIIYNGINPIYLTKPSANISKSQLLSTQSSDEAEQSLKALLKAYKITKPYFLFVSFWRKYKNIERLVKAFEQVQANSNESYQLVLGGSQDPKYPEILERVKESPEYKKGNIVVTGRIFMDTHLVRLQDGALAFVAPPLSEGFGLWMVEAAVRGTPIICSDIGIFHEILPDGAAIFFEPTEINDIATAMEKFLNMAQSKRDQMVRNAYQSTQKFRWNKIAETVLQVLINVEL